MSRSLALIAKEIGFRWANPYFGAKPYLRAMADLQSIDDSYGHDDGRSIVLYFLSNATSWRGPDAKRIKAELKTMLGRK